MFAVIYSFEIFPGRSDDFISSWSDLTNCIYQESGSLGSRLHKSSDSVYIAYAQWPDKETWENAGDLSSKEALMARQTMRESCKEIKVLYSMPVTADLLREKTI